MYVKPILDRIVGLSISMDSPMPSNLNAGPPFAWSKAWDNTVENRK
jgi:hypothetical protein